MPCLFIVFRNKTKSFRDVVYVSMENNCNFVIVESFCPFCLYLMLKAFNKKYLCIDSSDKAFGICFMIEPS